MRREEILRRLGVPQFRHRCERCRLYTDALYSVFDWYSTTGGERHIRRVEACETCEKIIRERNEQETKRRVDNEMQLKQANREHASAMQRSSSLEYRQACQEMRRALGIK
jgi:hypothetical protein